MNIFLCFNMIPRKTFWDKEYTDPDTHWTISGYSRAAFRTGFFMKTEVGKIMLDAGPQCFNKPDYIFITHSHGDHIANLPFTMIGDPEGDHMFNLFAPAASEPSLKNYIKALFETNSPCVKIQVEQWYNFYAQHPQKKYRIMGNKQQLEVETFQCDHSIPTISYGFSQVKNKLKAEYIGMPGKELGKLRKSGTEITQEVLEKRLAFVCDTNQRVFELNESLLEYPLIFIECTFLTDDELESAKKTKHIHWKHLKPIVEDNPQCRFVLIHFSLRYKDEEILEFFEAETEGFSKFKNVGLWLSDLERPIFGSA